MKRGSFFFLVILLRISLAEASGPSCAAVFSPAQEVKNASAEPRSLAEFLESLSLYDVPDLTEFKLGKRIDASRVTQSAMRESELTPLMPFVESRERFPLLSRLKARLGRHEDPVQESKSVFARLGRGATAEEIERLRTAVENIAVAHETALMQRQSVIQGLLADVRTRQIMLDASPEPSDPALASGNRLVIALSNYLEAVGASHRVLVRANARGEVIEASIEISEGWRGRLGALVQDRLVPLKVKVVYSAFQRLKNEGSLGWFLRKPRELQLPWRTLTEENLRYFPGLHELRHALAMDRDFTLKHGSTHGWASSVHEALMSDSNGERYLFAMDFEEADNSFADARNVLNSTSRYVRVGNSPASLTRNAVRRLWDLRHIQKKSRILNARAERLWDDVRSGTVDPTRVKATLKRDSTWGDVILTLEEFNGVDPVPSRTTVVHAVIPDGMMNLSDEELMKLELARRHAIFSEREMIADVALEALQSYSPFESPQTTIARIRSLRTLFRHRERPFGAQLEPLSADQLRIDQSREFSSLLTQ